jgi:uncharacterized damage-inducible protein DinB
VNFSTLFRHQAWADAALLAAVAAHPTALSNERLLKTLRHILRVQRVFLARFHGTDPDAERVVPHAFPDLVAVFRATAAEQLALVDSLTPADLARTFPIPDLGLQPGVDDGLTQVLFHSQNHRGQCLTRLRECGATPPILDYISWLKDRPMPSWPE